MNARNGSIWLLFVIAAFSVGCGKRGAPVPPRERVLQRVEVSGYQRGNQVVLSWRMPARNAPKSSVLNISRADIYRLAEPAGAPQELSEEEFANRSTVIAVLAISDKDFGLATLTYRDTLAFAGQAARLRYAIRFVNASGQKAGFSNTLLVEPQSRVVSAPSELKAQTSQDAITLSWQAPLVNIDGSTPLNLIGYNIYRSSSETEPAKLLNRAPVTDLDYSDEVFEFGKDYYYFVRAVSVGVRAEPLESAESNILRINAVDTFAPTMPTALTIAASPLTISIFFAANPERDIAGYRIYRSINSDLLKAEWELLTVKLLTTNTFQDKQVEAGKTYYYYVTAVDTVGNISGSSEVVSDTVP